MYNQEVSGINAFLLCFTGPIILLARGQDMAELQYLKFWKAEPPCCLVLMTNLGGGGSKFLFFTYITDSRVSLKSFTVLSREILSLLLVKSILSFHLTDGRLVYYYC